ncbi:MAG TPA: Smr/MutS family protein [Tenuifilaceae bacterium]|nr:Smr/MutS family protein [Tenuifilaceae bacterium]
MIYPETFEQKVGFDKLRELAVERCLCPLGVQKIRDVGCSSKFSEVELWIKQVDEMKSICMMEQGFPVDGYFDVTPSLRKIAKEGNWLDETELVNLRQSLNAIKQLITFVGKVTEKYPTIAQLAKGVSYYPYVTERIDAILDKFGRIKDNASSELAQIRSSITSRQSSVSKLVQTILRSARDQGVVESDVSPTIRDGRVVIPVAAGNKRKLKGIVHDESATGKTVFIEPVEVVELNNEIRELEYEEKREVVRILIEFANVIRPYLPDLLNAYNFMGEIDFIRAKALLAIEFNGTKPIINEGKGIFLKQAKHPILQFALKKEGKSVVPLDIELNQENRILLISGPNAGGKSVCLKTVGLLQYMFQCGFLPSALENSEMGVFKNIFIDIGDEQSIENDLSTYSSHLFSMKHFLKNADSDSLVLIDEFGAGTEPTAGGAIAEAILQTFCNLQTFGVITTHYSNLKHFAANTPGIINGAMLFDHVKIEPLFKLEMGKPGSSFAFEIARKIGLPEDVVVSAAGKVGADYVTFEKHLREISRDKRYWEKKRENIRIANKKADAAQEKLQKELEEVERQRKQIIADAKAEAESLLSDTNKTIENTIRIIKETNAQKEETKQAREELEQFKETVQNVTLTDAEIEKKIEQIKRRQERKAQKREDEKVVKKKVVAEKPIVPGDKVNVKGSDLVGEVLSISTDTASVAFGEMITVQKVNRLKRVVPGNSDNSKSVGFPQKSGFDVYNRRLNFKTDIDVRGFRADEALETVQDLVDDALMLGFSTVRILHGKGNGILRQVIRDYLKRTPGIVNFADEHEEFGGAGITVVELDV